MIPSRLSERYGPGPPTSAGGFRHCLRRANEIRPVRPVADSVLLAGRSPGPVRCSVGLAALASAVVAVSAVKAKREVAASATVAEPPTVAAELAHFVAVRLDGRYLHVIPLDLFLLIPLFNPALAVVSSTNIPATFRDPRHDDPGTVSVTVPGSCLHGTGFDQGKSRTEVPG
jgi:hypothetical protein